IIEKNQNIAGAIVMGGAGKAFADNVLDQLEYRHSIGEMKPEEYKFYKSQFELLKDPNFSSQNPPKNFSLGPP
ncbi:alpha/beta hydrolase, partial [Bacillus cereus]|nr:alpha/beta hydrolase [Bacillus cereus]